MKNIWLVMVAVIEVIGLGVLIGKGMQYRHYDFDNYQHISLTDQAYADRIVLNKDTLASYLGFMLVGEMEGRSAVEQRAYFCQIITICLSDEEKEYVHDIEALNYQILRNVIAYSKQFN